MSTRANEFGHRFDCLVINLKRQPIALREFLERNKRTGIEFQVFQAVDGREANNEALRNPDFITPDTMNYTPGALGAAMSHRKLWERCEQSGKPIIVFEDDAWIRADFCSIISASVPAGSQGWDIILCGYNLDSILDFELVPGCNLHGTFSVHHPTARNLVEFVETRTQPGAHRLANAFGTCGYILSPGGAQRLKASCFPLDSKPFLIPALHANFEPYSLDGVMNRVFRNISAWVCVPPLVLTPNRAISSTTVRGSKN